MMFSGIGTRDAEPCEARQRDFRPAHAFRAPTLLSSSLIPVFAFRFAHELG
jgi:hypothetical protein